MRIVIGLIMALSAGAASAQAARLPPPITQASNGSLQCYSPNAQAKTCRALAGYFRRADGTIANPSTVIITNSPLITMSAVSSITIKDAQVCGPLTAADVAAATFQVNGQPASPDQTAKLRAAVTGAMKGIFGKEICTAYVSVGGVITTKGSVDGVPQPAADQTVIWVSPSDGYQVAP